MALRPPPPVIVVDNASAGGAGPAGDHPAVVELIALDGNRGGAARTVGALPLAADALDRHPRLGLVAARTLVGPQERPDPVSEAMAASPLPDTAHLPGRPVLGCLACASVPRREAYLGAGGFRELFLVGGAAPPGDAAPQPGAGRLDAASARGGRRRNLAAGTRRGAGPGRSGRPHRPAPPAAGRAGRPSPVAAGPGAGGTAAGAGPVRSSVSVVVMTYNRRAELCRTLHHAG